MAASHVVLRGRSYRHVRLKAAAIVGVAAACLLGTLLLASNELPGHRRDAAAAVRKRLPDGTPVAIHKIRHVVVIMEEIGRAHV